MLFLSDGLTPIKTSVRVYTDLNREVSLPLSIKVSSRLQHFRQKVGNWIAIKYENILKRMTANYSE